MLGHRSFLPVLFISTALSACSLEVQEPTRDPSPAAETPATSESSPPTEDARIQWQRPYYGLGPSPSGVWERGTYDEAVARESLGSGDLTVLLVVDRSGSMSDRWDGGTKWDIVRGAIDHAIIGVERKLTIGTLFFPVDEQCGTSDLDAPEQIPFQRGERYQEQLLSVPLAPSGGTPLMAALDAADRAIEVATLDGLVDRRFRVVLMTDGDPNCGGDPDQMVALTDQWRELGVDVRVMGFPGSESARILLDRLAGKEVVEGQPMAPPSTVVDTESSSADQGYVAPEDAGDVDDSVYLIVR